ncbi:MAG: rRNA maturation RNase YbeY [Candidatus Shikimatogenerans sp. Tder]|uniref:rRNA maturation RNase YbeY n=1 Tax=Candidatus Shikimatogenerans sp. Tder TaxID=3158566 RepID=A0AAU7QRB1_9FLAO
MKKIYLSYIINKEKNKKNIRIYIEKLIPFIKFILNKEKIYNYTINYIFCNNKYIFYLNNIFFKKNKNTDVISLHYFYKKYLIGDIYISLEETNINSIYNLVNYKYEILRNVIHGILHIIGYLDDNIYDKNIMYIKQKKYILIYILKYFLKKKK